LADYLNLVKKNATMVTPIAGPKVGIQLIFPSMKQLNIAPVANATSPKVNG